MPATAERTEPRSAKGSPAWKALELHYKKVRKLHLRQLSTGDPTPGERRSPAGEQLHSAVLGDADLDAGGGVWRLERGYCMMIGGETGTLARLDPIFRALAPGPGEIARTPGREKLGGATECVSDSGEGRWTIEAAIDRAVPATVLTAALYERLTSRGEAGFANRLLPAMRFQFGGRVEETAEKRAA